MLHSFRLNFQSKPCCTANHKPCHIGRKSCHRNTGIHIEHQHKQSPNLHILVCTSHESWKKSCPKSKRDPLYWCPRSSQDTGNPKTRRGRWSRQNWPRTLHRSPTGQCFQGKNLCNLKRTRIFHNCCRRNIGFHLAPQSNCTPNRVIDIVGPSCQKKMLP